MQVLDKAGTSYLVEKLKSKETNYLTITYDATTDTISTNVEDNPDMSKLIIKGLTIDEDSPQEFTPYEEAVMISNVRCTMVKSSASQIDTHYMFGYFTIPMLYVIAMNDHSLAEFTHLTLWNNQPTAITNEEIDTMFADDPVAANS